MSAHYHKKLNKKTEIVLDTVAVVIWLLIWHFSATVANRNLMLKIPLPHETIAALVKDAGTSVFWDAVGSSVLHIMAGDIIATISGILLGFFTWKCQIFKKITLPLQRTIRIVPVAAFIIIAWLWLPNNILPSVISGLMVLPIVWTATENALDFVDVRYVEMAKTDGLGDFGTFWRIQLPVMSNQLRKGCITALGIAWKSGIAAEVICNPKGTLGAMLQSAKVSIEYEHVFSTTLAIVLICFGFEQLVKLLWKKKSF